MADRNPNIPSERRMEVEERTEINEKEANLRFSQKQAEIREQSGEFPPAEASNKKQFDFAKESRPNEKRDQ